jgi:DNA-binding winged helix-turn-helix (wHTH) protein/TolB-like protein/Tfp pilus assembly protein PilF
VHAIVRDRPDEVAKPDPVKRQPLRIGEWRIDSATNALDRAGRTVRIEPKAMEVLVALADRAGEVVSREELLAAVWPGVVVGDDVLTQSINKLRKALGDKPRSPAYIETISKRGYRLIAPVAPADGLPAAPGGNGDAAHRSLASRRGVRWLGIAALAVLASTLAGIHFVDSRSQRPAAAASANAGGAEDVDETGLVTVTVVPFETVGGGTEQDYLARGIGSDLMTDLSRLSGLRVIGASPGMAARPIAARARYVVSGSIQRKGPALRVNVRLVDSRNGEQLWSRRFERPFGDLIAIQNEITRELVEQLPGTISDAERRQLAKRYTNSPEAYDAFLRAKALFLVRSPKANLEARELYMKALELDPQFARAYAGLAMTYAMEYRYDVRVKSPAPLDRGSQLARTALAIDPDIPEVHWALGFIQAQARHHDLAIKSLQRAIEQNRSYADAYALMAGIYTYMGEAQRSVPLLRKALRLHPDGGYLYFLILGRAYLFEDDIEQALINLREALKRNPDDLEARIYLAAALVAAGDRGAAEWEADEIRSREADFSMRRWLATYPLASAPYEQRLLALTAQAGL